MTTVLFGVVNGAASGAVIHPIVILLVGICWAVAGILILKLHPFFSLISAAFAVSLLSAINQTADNRFLKAIDIVTVEFGTVAGKLGFAIAAAAVIGMCLIESGAGDKLVRRFLALFGEQNAAITLLILGFCLSAPVFNDIVMMLLMPIARILSLRLGKNFLIFVVSISMAGSVSNGLIPPAPGPILVAETLKIDLGIALFAGIAFAIPVVLIGYLVIRWMNKRMVFPVRPLPGASSEMIEPHVVVPESELPSFVLSFLPVLLPVLLIAVASLDKLTHLHGNSTNAARVIEFLGNRNVALGIGMLAGLFLLAKQKKLALTAVGKRLGHPLESAGVIVLMISAGGAFGATLTHTGVGDVIRDWAESHSFNYVFLAWLVAAVVRAAQGSSTVASLTALGIMVAVAGTNGFGVHPLYIYLAIGFGAKFLDWMNDSYFWVINRFSGLTQNELLKTWTVISVIISLVGLGEVLLFSSLFPKLSLAD